MDILTPCYKIVIKAIYPIRSKTLICLTKNGSIATCSPENIVMGFYEDESIDPNMLNLNGGFITVRYITGLLPVICDFEANENIKIGDLLYCNESGSLTNNKKFFDQKTVGIITAEHDRGYNAMLRLPAF